MELFAFICYFSPEELPEIKMNVNWIVSISINEDIQTFTPFSIASGSDFLNLNMTDKQLFLT